LAASSSCKACFLIKSAASFVLMANLAAYSFVFFTSSVAKA